MRINFFFTIIICLLISQVSIGQVFEEYILEYAGAEQIEMVDLNNDGLEDITYDIGTLVHVKYKTGPQVYDVPSLVGNTGLYYEFHDLDKDGDQDLIYASGNNIYVQENVNAVFSPKQEVGYVIGVKEFSLGDFNNDGFTDIAAGAGTDGLQNDKRLIVIQNNGDMSFTTNVLGTNLSFILNVEAMDVDEDNDLDLMTYFSSSETIKMYLNDGSGQFTLSDSLIEGILYKPTSFESADMNNDNRPDLVFSFEDWSKTRLYVLYNLEGLDWSLSTIKEFNHMGSYGSVRSEVVDFDADGDNDIFFTSSYFAEVYVAINRQPGVLEDSLIYREPDFSRFITTISGTDVNEDGRIDPVYYSYKSGGDRYIASFLETTTATFEPAHEAITLHCSPNPSQTFFSINEPYALMEDQEIFATDAIGRSYKLSKQAGSNIIYHALSPGIYFISIQDASAMLIVTQ